MNLKLVIGSTLAMSTLGITNLAFGDEAAPRATAEPPAAEPATAGAPAVAEEPARKPTKPAPVPEEESDEDGVRFRGGVSGGAGAEIVLDYGTAGMGGVDGRLGVQVMDLLGIYAQLHTSLGAFGGDGNIFFGLTGTVAATLLADFTFIDQIFVGAGAGYGVLNNPHGPVIHLRAGGYPYVDFGEDGVRRKGFMVGVDMRVFIADPYTAIYPMVQVGYEAF